VRIARVAPMAGGAPFFARDDGDVYTGIASPFGPLRVTVDGTGRALAKSEARVLAPVEPSKVVCIGRNYAAHAKEMQHDVPDEPLLFLKPPSSVIGPLEPIFRPTHLSSLVHHEGELAVVIGKAAHLVDKAHALAHVFGYTIGNDVTARDLQRKDVQFTRGKGFDTFCPLGPVIVTADEIPDPQSLELSVHVNDELRQHGHTRDMVFSIAVLISAISRVMTLESGDVILSGTPEGVGPLVAGDAVRVTVTGIGTLENSVVDARFAQR
jgi:2-keto-4-pentenoate hydratase/2-oxohepta-3-ene-1,7-dioic acid hydratase in catechol pathway